VNLARDDGIYFKPVRSVIYGHFLSPASEDAALSAEGHDSHASFFGGTLLLTKQNGNWQPVWYKASVISRYCRILAPRSGRDTLLCEFEDGGMGHSYHFLYTLDLTNPQDPVHAALLVADSYLLMCEDFQKQTIEAIDIEPGAIDILLRGGSRRVLESEKDDCGYSRPLSPPRERSYGARFTMDGDRLKPDASSANALALFRLR
jgi:hypothetical protein